MQKCSAIARRTTISARFSDTILERIASRNAKFRDAKMLRDRTPDGHFGSLFGYHSGTYRFPEREIPGCKKAPRSHAGRPFRAAQREPFRSVSLRGTRNSGIQKCSVTARLMAISARFSDTIPQRIASRNAKFLDAKMLGDRTPGDHFGPLNGNHSGAYRFGEREILGSENAPRSHAGRPFRAAFRLQFRNESLQGREILGCQHAPRSHAGLPFRFAFRMSF